MTYREAQAWITIFKEDELSARLWVMGANYGIIVTFGSHEEGYMTSHECCELYLGIDVNILSPIFGGYS